MAPNIVLFLTDQLRRDALGCYGNEICQTPNLDQLAEEGVRFDQAYTTSPVCSPARASLMSGLYPHNHGVMLNTHIAPAWNRGLSTDVPTFSRLLKEAGYVLDYAGKWHVHQDIGPEGYGFDRHEMGTGGRGKIAPGTELTVEFPGSSFPVAGTGEMSPEEYKTWMVTDCGIEMLRERAGGDKPFFFAN